MERKLDIHRTTSDLYSMSYRGLIDGESLAERQLGSGMRRLGRAYDMVGLRGGSSPSLMRR